MTKNIKNKSKKSNSNEPAGVVVIITSLIGPRI